MQLDIGLLVACFTLPAPAGSSASGYCIVRTLQQMDVLGQVIKNKYDCPLLSMTNLLYCIPSNSVSHSVSVVHECTDYCIFVNNSGRLHTRRIEHESVESSFSFFKHDLSNKKCIALTFTVLMFNHCHFCH